MEKGFVELSTPWGSQFSASQSLTTKPTSYDALSLGYLHHHVLPLSTVKRVLRGNISHAEKVRLLVGILPSCFLLEPALGAVVGL